MKQWIICLIILVSSGAKATSLPEHIKILNYDGYNMLFDCEQRAPIIFQMVLSRDKGYTNREEKFRPDPNFDKNCQQKNGNKYGKRKGTIYHRGHLISANSQDGSRRSIDQTFIMTNIVPQAGEFNRGAWYLTEMYEECLRDISDIKVIGGVLFHDERNDYFIKSHGIRTPDTFWKVIQTKDGYYAWAFPNSDVATRDNASAYSVSIDKLRAITGFPLEINNHRRLSNSTLPNTDNCNLG